MKGQTKDALKTHQNPTNLPYKYVWPSMTIMGKNETATSKDSG